MWCTGRAVNHSDYLMPVPLEIKEPLFRGEPRFCASILNWDCGAKLGFTYKRMGISQGHEVPKWNLGPQMEFGDLGI